jgi:hypothetical protein
VGALSLHIEAAGIATTQISLVREHTAAMAPPRALWVPFPLGRPLGVPNDTQFQRKVLLGALRLLERASGPVLEDFPEDAPKTAEDDDAPVACPVSFAKPRSGSLADQMKQEMANLAPWYAIARERRKRSTAGLSGLTPDEAANYICDFIEQRVNVPYRPELQLGLALRLACEDIKSYYLEACSAQPGNASHQALFRWFWAQTIASKILVRLRAVCATHQDRSVRVFGSRNLIPRAAEPLVARA